MLGVILQGCLLHHSLFSELLILSQNLSRVAVFLGSGFSGFLTCYLPSHESEGTNEGTFFKGEGMLLSEMKCRQAKAKDKAYKLFDGGGLFLLVTTKGQRYWRLNYRFLNKPKTLALGVYPAVTLVEAREARDQAKKLLMQGLDPGLKKKEQRLQRKVSHDNSFQLVAEEWLEKKRKSITPKYAFQIQRRLERDVYPRLGHVPISEVTPHQILDVLHTMEKRGAYELTHRVYQIIKQIFRYAVATQRLRYNVATDLGDALTPVKITHYPALKEKELPAFLRALQRNDARLYPVTRMSLELLMLTFVRTSELIGAKREEFDLKTKIWEIPAERMKMKRSHLVPLSKQAGALVQELMKHSNSDFLLASPMRPQKAMSNNTILKAIAALGYKHKMTGHGFRATATTICKESLGYRKEVVDRQLAHAHESKNDAAYDRAEFLEERKRMMQDYADFIDRLREN